ncbi:DUF4129 domain-containing protein [Aquibacillus koreensis]|uniref:DUF4129 domain-containing protein n=1 Tax=Aquibacillus koreensis TaxID=279446 RepID=A0A9X3WNU5_9BACI|nr:DUF4129 domain-containing protein [Aquibacillus koreensis]MCT2534236.1 DUF4129 domain-containing protein [Aquibacillus koreensis]MDC3420719.1 DUF4129 domain-containing protein [Aquibacillus koreensis]
MLIKVRNFFQKWLLGMIEYLILFPIVFLIGIYFVPTEILGVWLAMFSCLFLVGLCVRKLVKERSYVVYIFLSLILSTAPAIFISDSVIGSIFTFLFGGLVVLRGMMYATQSWVELSLTRLLWTAGFPIYFISYLFYLNIAPMTPYVDMITWLGIVMILITFFVSNEEHLKTATHAKTKDAMVSRVIKNTNRIYLAIMFIAIILLTNFQVVQTLFVSVVGGILQTIINITEMFPSNGVEDPQSRPRVEFMFSGGEDQSSFNVWMNWLTIIGGSVLVLALLVLSLMLIFKRTRIIVKRWFAYIQKVFARIFRRKKDDNVGGYIDESESLIDWKLWREKVTTRAKEVVSSFFSRGPQFHALSNKEKVRYIYRHLLAEKTKNGFEVKPSNTPHETLIELQREVDARLLEELDDAYGQARYSNKDGEHLEVDHLRSLVNTSKR